MSGNRATRDNRDLRSIVPQGVSARRLIRQMNLWGWTEGKTRGDHVEMSHPEKTETLWVYRSTVNQHCGNESMRQVYRVVCGGDAIQFWSRETQYIPKLDNATSIDKRRVIAPATSFRFDAPTVEESMAAHPSNPEPEPEPEPEPDEVNMNESNIERKPSGSASANRGVSWLILDYLQEKPHNTIHTGESVGLAVGVDTRAALDAMRYLCNIGHVKRIMRGKYKLATHLAASETVHHVHSGPVEHLQKAQNETDRAAALHQEIETDPQVVLERHKAHDKDDYLDSLLELVLPDNYKFKPRHLDAMARWKQATAELLEVLSS